MNARTLAHAAGIGASIAAALTLTLHSVPAEAPSAPLDARSAWVACVTLADGTDASYARCDALHDPAQRFTLTEEESGQ